MTSGFKYSPTGHAPEFIELAQGGPVLHSWDCECGTRGIARPSLVEAEYDFADHAQAVAEQVAA